MKKIICLILALTCAIGCTLALASCEKETPDTEQGGKPQTEEKTVYTMARNSNPTKVVTFVEYKTSDNIKLGGEYVMEIEGNNSITTYDYNRLRTVEEGAIDGTVERIKNVKGAVYFKDGRYSEDGKTWGAEAVEGLDFNFKFDLNPEYLTNAKVSEDQKLLTATLTAENAVKVFGTDLKAQGDVALTVTTNGTYLTGVELTCTTVSGAKMAVKTSYSYNTITLVFPEA